MSIRAEGSRHAAFAGVTIALVAPVALLAPVLPAGGLAPLVVAGVVAALVGAPVALLEWRTPPEPSAAWEALERTGTDLVVGLMIAAVAAGLVAPLGWVGLPVLVAGWAVAWALSRVSARVRVLPALLGVIAAVVAGGFALAQPPAPWTLLTPTWGTWPQWGGSALIAGLWMGGVGTGQWTRGPLRRPGDTRAPWAGAGAASLLVCGLAVHQAGRFEVAADGSDWLSAVVVGLTLLPAAATVLRRRSDAHVSAAFGAASSGWLAGPAVASLPFGLATALPLGMAAAAALVARRQSAALRAPLLAVAVALGAAALLGWPGLPVRALDAGLLGLTLTVGFWLVATPTALARLGEEAP